MKAKKAYQRSDLRDLDAMVLFFAIHSVDEKLTQPILKNTNAMTMRRLVLGRPSYASHTTVSRAAKRHDYHGLSMLDRSRRDDM